jgi:hypothetical protein
MSPTWLASVPLQAAQSEAVALALMAAFKGLEASGQGILKSRADLGTVVHDCLAKRVAAELVATPGILLVADNKAWVAGNPDEFNVAYVAGKLEQIDKDYSLRVLAQSRGSKAALFVRSKDTEVSREDMVVFKGTGAAALVSSLGLEGRPEVYEVKPMSRLSEAVAQVTAYAWNYLVADVIWKCAKLPSLPGASISNSVMIPADPEVKAISLPVISLETLSAVGSVATLRIDAAAADIAKLVQNVIGKAIVRGPCMAIPSW